jgi:Phage integrase family
MREHLYLAPPGDVGRGADVVGVEVRQHQPPQVRGLVSGLADRFGDQRRGAGEPGVDEGQPVGVVPQVGMPDRKPDEVQARHQLDDVHEATVSACQTCVPVRSAAGRTPARSGRVFWLVAGVAKLAEQADDPVGHAPVAVGLAVPAAFLGVAGQLALDLQTLAQARRVLGSGDELGAGQVEVAFARAFPGQAQAVAEFQFGLALLPIYAGLRVSETVALDTDDVRLSARKGNLRVRGKGTTVRDLPIHPQLRTDLRTWLDERPGWPGAGTSPALLLNRRGRRLSVRGASDIIRVIAADANLDEEHITAHVGRHTFATTLKVSGGTDLVAVADMLGHASLDTVRLYTHPSAADRERALNLLPYDR